jgi:hypothetical protein
MTEPYTEFREYTLRFAPESVNPQRADPTTGL